MRLLIVIPVYELHLMSEFCFNLFWDYVCLCVCVCLYARVCARLVRCCTGTVWEYSSKLTWAAVYCWMPYCRDVTEIKLCPRSCKAFVWQYWSWLGLHGLMDVGNPQETAKVIRRYNEVTICTEVNTKRKRQLTKQGATYLDKYSMHPPWVTP